MQSITPEIEDEIRRLHHEYPNLGHEGIGKVLEDAGILLDEYELRIYMEEHNLAPGQTSTWKSRLSGWHLPWLGP